MRILLVFALLNVDCFCESTNYVDENYFDQQWVGANSPTSNIGRPTKLIIDEIITRSVSFPAKRTFGSNFRSTNYPPSENYPSEDYPSNNFPLNDFMLTNRRRDEPTDNSGFVEGETYL
jgi:hypothetical protein